MKYNNELVVTSYDLVESVFQLQGVCIIFLPIFFQHWVRKMTTSYVALNLHWTGKPVGLECWKK